MSDSSKIVLLAIVSTIISVFVYDSFITKNLVGFIVMFIFYLIYFLTMCYYVMKDEMELNYANREVARFEQIMKEEKQNGKKRRRK